MTYTANTGEIWFAGSSATPQTVTTAGKTVYRFYPSGTGTTVLSDALTVSNQIFHSAGTFDTNSQTITSLIFNCSGSTARTLTLGSSAITLSGTGTAWNAATVTNLTVTANTATVTLTGAGASFASGAQNWNGMSLVLTGSGNQTMSVSTGCTLANVTRTGTAVKTDAMPIGGGFTVTGTFTVTGNSETNRVLVYSSTLGTARTITAATTSLTNVDFRDITAAGAAAWTGTSLGDAQGNTGITFTTPTTCTHNAGAAGNWSTAANWDTGTVPLCHDTVVIPATTTGTLTNDMPRMGADIDWSAFTGTFAFGAIAAEVYGNLTAGSGVTYSGGNRITLRGRGNHTITSAGKTWTVSFSVDCATGTYTLADAATISVASAGVIQPTSGTFNDGGFAITFTAANSAWTIAGGTTTLSGTQTIASTTNATPWNYIAGTVNHTGTIALTGATTTARTFAGGGQTYGTLTDTNTNTGRLTITGANTFGTINKTAVAACTLTLPTSDGITITGLFNVTGADGAVLTLTGDITKAEGTVSCDYLDISSSDATGGATFYAGANSTDSGSNTGWIFGAPTGITTPYQGGTHVGGALNTRPAVDGALVVT
jgi:hypothetical protein